MTCDSRRFFKSSQFCRGWQSYFSVLLKYLKQFYKPSFSFPLHLPGQNALLAGLAERLRSNAALAGNFAARIVLGRNSRMRGEARQARAAARARPLSGVAPVRCPRRAPRTCVRMHGAVQACAHTRTDARAPRLVRVVLASGAGAGAGAVSPPGSAVSAEGRARAHEAARPRPRSTSARSIFRAAAATAGSDGPGSAAPALVSALVAGAPAETCFFPVSLVTS